MHALRPLLGLVLCGALDASLLAHERGQVEPQVRQAVPAVVDLRAIDFPKIELRPAEQTAGPGRVYLADDMEAAAAYLVEHGAAEVPVPVTVANRRPDEQIRYFQMPAGDRIELVGPSDEETPRAGSLVRVRSDPF